MITDINLKKIEPSSTPMIYKAFKVENTKTAIIKKK